MRFSQQFRMSMTRRGEKEARLGAFIARSIHALQGLGASDGSAAARADIRAAVHGGEREVLIIARSAQSPVVKSTAALAREIAAAGCSVRILLARNDRPVPADALSDALIAASGAALGAEVRRARNPRLVEAHEQLVLARHACWTGDTMRRDPATCDAYESFVEDCPELAATAAATFERLWADAEPCTDLAAMGTAGLATPKAIGPPAALARRP
jgi:hypothetical protein